MAENDRAFKGIWIPKEIWLNEKLKTMEKLFLVEIDSLDNDEGCFAGNEYFSKFFGLSKQRCSEIIKSLEKKGFITIIYNYKEGTKSIEKRILKVSIIENTPLREIEGGVRKTERGVRKTERGVRKTEGGYSEKLKDNNTSTNNTINNTINNTTQFNACSSENEFENKSLIEKRTHLKITKNQLKKIEEWDSDRLSKSIEIFLEKKGRYFSLLEKIYMDNGNFAPKEDIQAKDKDLKFNNFKPRDYDYESLERKLLGWDED